jgi:hypothetical protein
VTLRNYTNDAPQLALTTAVNTSAVTLAVTSTAGYPAVPFTLTLERGTVNQEVTTCTSLTATTFTVTRATTPKSHAIGASVEHTSEAKDYSEANVHVNATALTDDPHPQYLREAAFTTKGQILVATGNGTFTPLTVGANNTVALADSAAASGVKWGTIVTASITDAAVTVAKVDTNVEKSLVRRLAAAPAGPLAGEMYFNTATSEWLGYIAAAWNKVPYGAGRITISTAAPTGGADRDIWFRY